MRGKDKRGFNPDLILARNQWEVVFSNANIPRRFWNVDSKTIKFQQIKVEKETITAEAQRQWLNRLIKHPPRNRPLLAVSSEPTDTGAMYLAITLAIRWMKTRGTQVAIIDLADDKKYFDEYPHFIVMHNILSSTNPDRLDKIRDLCIRFKNSFRLVVIANEKQPYNWMLKKLALRPTAAFRIKDR